MRRGSFVFVVALGMGILPARFVRADSTPASASDELVAAGKAVDDKPDSPDAYDAFAQVAFRLKRWDDAIARLKQGVARIPSYHGGLYKLAYAYRQAHDFPAAASAYRRFIELEPARVDAYFGLGAALQGAGDAEGALAAYSKYVELERAPEKQRFVEQAKAEMARLKSAAKPIAPAPATTPATTPAPAPVPAPKPAGPAVSSPPGSDAIALRKQGERARHEGKLDEAATAYERAAASDPGNLDVHVELGDVYFAQRRYADAARVFRATVERDAGYALGWYNLAHAESRAGEHGAAVRAYREYIRLRPSDPDPYYGLGQAYKTLGDKTNAIEAFKTYLKMERRPESQRWIDKARRELESLEGPHAKAPGMNDLKNPFSDGTDDRFPPSVEVSRREHERIQREIIADDILPISEEEVRVGPDLKDPFEAAPATNRDRLARYATALAAYRAALDRQADEVATLYQRGAERILSNDLKGAQRAWTATLAGERNLEEARARLDKARALLKATN